VTPLGLSRGLGLLPEVIVDSHFAERGRFGRLLSAVAQEPALLGVGIDEDTAVVVEGGRFRTIGRGAVYVVDGRELAYVDPAERPLGLGAAHGARVHFLTAGGAFDLTHRRPLLPAEPDLLDTLDRTDDALVAG
jgi:cyanophycinase